VEKKNPESHFLNDASFLCYKARERAAILRDTLKCASRTKKLSIVSDPVEIRNAPTPPEYKSEWSKLHVYTRIEGSGSLEYMFGQKWRGLTEQYIGMSMARERGEGPKKLTTMSSPIVCHPFRYEVTSPPMCRRSQCLLHSSSKPYGIWHHSEWYIGTKVCEEISVLILVNNQLDAQYFVRLFLFATCFGQPCDHHQENYCINVTPGLCHSV
jgi:hypothetical protein